MSVLIVGNVTKDVYLRLDERTNKFETDENGTAWLDLSFDASTHHFFRRNSVFGGATVSLEVLNNFGIEAKIAGTDIVFQDGDLIKNAPVEAEYRYILCKDDDPVYFVDKNRAASKWEMPDEAVDWIFIDRSAVLDEKLVEKILNYLSLSNKTRLAVFVTESWPHVARALAENADLVFLERRRPDLTLRGQICLLENDNLSFDQYNITCYNGRTDLMTHLTLHSIAAATILGATILGKSSAEATKLAEINVAKATLNGTLSLKRLEELID